MVDGLRIEQVTADHPDVTLLVTEVQAEYARRYGTPDESPVDVAEFTLPEGAFLLGYVGDTVAVSGAWRRVALPAGAPGSSAAEVKRMYVRPAYQRGGLARVMLARLEEEIRSAGCDVAVLSTGTRQPEAIALYESCGYVPIGGFGHYANSPVNRSFAKALLAP
jgi:GNAT superfamily N-acetyltransferase